MSLSQITAASPAASFSEQLNAEASLDFFHFFKATYPDGDAQATAEGSRKSKSRGMVVYQCLHCLINKP